MKDRFDYEIIIGSGLHKGRKLADIVRDLSGDRFRINLNNKLFIEGVDDYTVRIQTVHGFVTRTYCAEEKTWLKSLAAKTVELFIANQEIAVLKAKLAASEAHVVELCENRLRKDLTEDAHTPDAS